MNKYFILFFIFFINGCSFKKSCNMPITEKEAEAFCHAIPLTKINPSMIIELNEFPCESNLQCIHWFIQYQVKKCVIKRMQKNSVDSLDL